MCVCALVRNIARPMYIKHKSMNFRDIIYYNNVETCSLDTDLFYHMQVDTYTHIVMLFIYKYTHDTIKITARVSIKLYTTYYYIIYHSLLQFYTR